MSQICRQRAPHWSLLLGLAVFFAAGRPTPAQPAALQLPVITNLHDLTASLASEQRLWRDLLLEVTVCAASKPAMGIIIAQDESGIEWLQFGNFGRDISPGEKVLIRGWYRLLRKRDSGIELSPGPVVDNDGMHIKRSWDGNVKLNAGRNPIRIDWFNALREYFLEVSYFPTNDPAKELRLSNLWHESVDPATGVTNFLPGLTAACYEGYWESIPDFELYQPVKIGIVSNVDLSFRTRDEMIAIRYTGYLNAPAEGEYTFRIRSDDGGILFVGAPVIPVTRTGNATPPKPISSMPGEQMSNLTERRWTAVEGRAGFVSRKGAGLEFELRSGQEFISVRVADGSGLDPTRLQNSRVKVTGLGRGVLSSDQRVSLGLLYAINAKDIALSESPEAPGEMSSPITSVAQVQGLRIEDARKALPVRIRGVVTDARNSGYQKWMSLQDDTRGIFVRLGAISNALPAFSEYWEVVGHSDAGDFAPVVVAEQLNYLGKGQVPEPARPTWRELVNGSQDVQWTELQGLVTDVASNMVTLLLPQGSVSVRLDHYYENELKAFQKSLVRIRGVLYAIWSPQTREVRVGTVVMRNARISIETPAPADPFDAPSKTPRELFLFDPQASSFQRVKVRAQVVYADAKLVLAVDSGFGLRILPLETKTLHPGDLIEAVGYPDISGPSPLLREAFARKTGVAPLPSAREVDSTELLQRLLDATPMHVEARLVGFHSEQDTLVLEMQAGYHLFFARLPAPKNQELFQVGSRLGLTGVYLVLDVTRRLGKQVESFELLLNSVDDIAVLSKPPWWNLQRLLSVVGALLFVLALAATWIALLRRRVDQRTRQLRREIRVRERAEREHAIEAERSRIARDLHDDLGSSLTEIGVLASTGQRQNVERELPVLFSAIAVKARSLLSALDVIVWAVDPEANSLQSVADYLSGFVGDFLSHSDISCRFQVPVTFPDVTLDGQVRHDLLMAVKESLNNVVRHAKATEVEFHIAVLDGTLEIVIADNGKGFELGGGRNGHGLKNLPVRLSKAGGSCHVDSMPGEGTKVTIRLPLASGVSLAESI